MFKKIFNNESKTITGAAIIIAGATLVSRIIGLIRDRIFAHYFGAGNVMDAYYTAFKIPDLVYSLLILGALSAGFIPVFTKIFYHNKSQAWKLANNIVNIAGVALVIVCTLGIIFANKLAPLIAPGFDKESLLLVIKFSRIMFLSPLLLGISMIMGGVLQSLRQFLTYSIAPIFYNLGIIFGTVVLTKYFDEMGLALGVVLGALIHLIIQTTGAYFSGYRWRPVFDLHDKNTILIGLLMIPRTLGLAVSQINIVILTILATLLPIGSVSVYNYANNLQGVAVGIIGIPFALAIFPVLSKASAKKDYKTFINTVAQTTKKILFLIFPATVIILFLRAQIVRVILGSGEFGWSATVNTADTLAFFALSLFAQSLIPLFARAFYSLEDTKTPFVIALISELVTIIFAMIFMRQLGVSGLALAVSIGAILNITLLVATLKETLGSLNLENIFSSFYKIAIASIVMAVVVQLSKYPLAKIFNQQYFWGILGQGLIAGLLGIATYALICYLLKLEEFNDFVHSFNKNILKIKNIKTTESIDIK